MFSITEENIMPLIAYSALIVFLAVTFYLLRKESKELDKM
jgi:cbb3-type cytochrome oxidase subunit 3